MTETSTIAVAMSGGVDSSAVAAMLSRSGETVVGLTLQLWDQTRLAGKHGIPEAPKAGRCCSLDDVYDARRVAEHLGIPYYVVNHQERFEEAGGRPVVEEYLAGRTPIPCSLCNDHLKFDQLLQTARSIGAERIATGHYAVNEYDAARGRWILKRPADRSKDQTYFLFGLTQEQLSRTLFPLGGYRKAEVREIAAAYALPIPLFGHIGDGNLHPNILCDKTDREEMVRVAGAARAIFEATVELGGTLSGEHGIGLLKKQFMELDLGPDAIAVMRKIKDALDPLGIMNPGKVFPDPGGADAFRL